MSRYVCIHGHFYQPPRENPWSGAIERQPSAAPHHDWNARIAEECYAPNAAATLLDARGRVRAVSNNYARMSFNFGPTLLSWLERHTPRVYTAILEADRDSAGHAALAQAYNHTILPLTPETDRRCQIVWGVRDFEHRFGRRPRGLWLPETAVDTTTLELLVDAGIDFTILAPHQALRVRPAGNASWTESGDEPDTRVAYEQTLPSGRAIRLFFYDGALARGVAFERWLGDGPQFVARILDGFADDREDGQLVHLATDGETYGHHHKFGDMALAYALERLEADDGVTLTTYAGFLERHPPRHEVQIVENSSWSCSHGVERWRGGCRCGLEGHADWSEAWRRHLYDALTWLHCRIVELFPASEAAFLDFIDVVLDPSADSRRHFLERHASAGIDDDLLWDALEMRRAAMLMFTSCGWFFEDLSRIEARQVLSYAARAIELARRVSGEDLEPGLLERLEPATCNREGYGNGRELFLRRVTRSAGPR